MHYKLAYPFTVALLLLACSDINNSWEDVGGGFVKYKVNGSSERTIGLDPRDATVPSYWNHYFSLTTNEDSSKIGDYIMFTVASPKLGKNAVVHDYTCFKLEFGNLSCAIVDSSTVTIDQKNDSTWTGNFNLYFPRCYSEDECSTDSIINVTGRFRYWPDPNED